MRHIVHTEWIDAIGLLEVIAPELLRLWIQEDLDVSVEQSEELFNDEILIEYGRMVRDERIRRECFEEQSESSDLSQEDKISSSEKRTDRRALISKRH